MKLSALALAVVALLFGAFRQAQAGFIVRFEQDGNNVVATGSGSLNLNGLINSGFDSGAPSGVRGQGELFYLGNTSTGTEYNGLVGPSNVGTGLFFQVASSATGSWLAQDSTQLFVQTGYVSGNSLSNTTTWDNTTISGLGLTPGTYFWTWGSGGNADFYEAIIPASAPEPATFTLLSIGIAGMAGYRLRRRKVAAA